MEGSIIRKTCCLNSGKASTKSNCSESDGNEGKLHTYDEVEALLLSQIPMYLVHHMFQGTIQGSIKLQHDLWFAPGRG